MLELTEEISPCRGCINTEKGITECRDACKRLKAYQSNLPYNDIKVPDADLDMVFEKKSVKNESWDESDGKKEIVGIENVKKKILKPKKIKSDIITSKVNRYRAYTNKICLHCKKRKAVKSGLCEKDYLRWYKGLIKHPVEGKWRFDADRQKKRTNWPDCEIEGCTEKGNKRGLCEKHYKGWHTGIILHPTLGEYFVIRPQKRFKSGGNMSEEKKDEKTDERKFTIDFEQYPDLFFEIKRLAEDSFLPELHMVINLLAAAIKVDKENSNNGPQQD